MGQTSVTQEQWAVVAKWEKVVIDLDPDPSPFKGKQRPVEQVSWQEAIEFCARLRRKNSEGIFITHRDTVEYACRAGTETPFYFGETITTDLANYDGNGTYGRGENGIYGQETTPVAKFPANRWGIYDMHGNVYEWCLDPWHDSYQQKTQKDGEVWDEETSIEKYVLDKNNVSELLKNSRRRVLRGGSWNYGPGNCRSAFRSRNYPDYRYYLNGFRVVCRFSRL